MTATLPCASASPSHVITYELALGAVARDEDVG